MDNLVNNLERLVKRVSGGFRVFIGDIRAGFINETSLVPNPSAREISGPAALMKRILVQNIISEAASRTFHRTFLPHLLSAPLLVLRPLTVPGALVRKASSLAYQRKMRIAGGHAAAPS
jgi:hypothetical protein